MKILTVAEMALREIARRRSVLLILALLPLAFYLSRRDGHLGQSIRFVCLGIGWALSTAALFAGNAARGMEPRLRLSGYSAAHLHVGKLVALWLLGAALAVPYFVLIRLDDHHPGTRYAAIAAIMVFTVAVAAPFGLLLSAVLPRELEGTLVLLTVVGLQMLLEPATVTARLLPFWFVREIGTYAIDGTDAGYLHRGLLHAAVTLMVLLVAGGAAALLRLRGRRRLTVSAPAG